MLSRKMKRKLIFVLTVAASLMTTLQFAYWLDGNVTTLPSNERSISFPPIGHQPLILQGAPSVNNPMAVIFPRWEDPNGIPFRPLLDFVDGLLNDEATTISNPKTRSRFPETLYIIDEHGIWTSHLIRRRTWRLMVQPRLKPTE